MTLRARGADWLRQTLEQIEERGRTTSIEARPRARERTLEARGFTRDRAGEGTASSPAAATPLADRGPLAVCLIGSLCLVLMEYVGAPRMLSELLEAYESRWPGLLWGQDGLYASRWLGLMDLGWWVGFRLLGFFVLPALAIRLWLRRPLREFGLMLGGLRSSVPVYAALFLALVPVLAFASMRPEFVAYYPFYKRAGESWFDLLAWELLYAAHFVALEFFFRGFWLEACRASMGTNAIFFMVVPYCMIHFTKPALEVIAAIPAGLVLGLLAMHSRSIWGGAALHVAVALSMDMLALLKGSGLPTRFWPGP